MSGGVTDNPLSGPSDEGTLPEVTPERWQKVKELLLAAEEADPANRDEFLRQACGSDEALRAEIESLLAADHSAVDSGLGTTRLMQKAGLRAAAIDPMVGHRVGAYEIVRPIGHGGMAVVYLAVRADDAYRKQVAVKLVRSGLDNAEVLSRFRSERQTLASLDHPNIVRLIDGGSTAEGVPYLVMDYVEGMPIDEYCDTHQLSIERRLRLFGNVCDAVQYAHQKLVVHRDLKPSNILVTADGVPKLLDFGISKVLSPDASELSPLVTQTATRRMTPAYASPEQVRGKTVTPPSDIYSLGVVLYELLTGHRPYRLKQRTPAELEQAICEQEPENPSTAVDRVETETSPDGATVSKTPELVSKTREGEAEKLRRRLRGDLDNIVLMALQKEPQRRYSSVAELSLDIECHLNHLPVKARPRTLTYRASKFVRRHKTEVAAALSTGLLFLLVGAWIVAYPSKPEAQPRLQRLFQITDDARQKNGGDFLQLIPSPYVQDGNMLYFTEMRDGQMILARVPVNGGEPSPVSTSLRGGALLGDFSPIRAEFLLLQGADAGPELTVWIMPRGSGKARRLGDILASSATWSSDARWVLYTHQHGIYVCEPDGTGIRKLTEVERVPVLPRLSPNGDVVRFTQYNPKDFTSSLWEVGWDGNGLKPLLPNWNGIISSCCGNWLRDSRYFVFRANREGTMEVWVLPEGGRADRKKSRAPVQLTTGPIDYYNLAVSSDRNRIFAMGRQRRAELQRFDAQRSEFVPYLNGISAMVTLGNGHIVSATLPEGTLWASTTDGKDRIQLTMPPMASAEFPRLSADGRRVVFSAVAAPRGVSHIYTVSVDGGPVQQLSFGDDGEAYPDWSPDNSQAVYSGFEAWVAGPSSAQNPIHIVKVGSGETTVVPGSEGLVCPRWSPDGRYLTAESADESRLMLYDFRTHQWGKVAANLSFSCMNWSHDSRYIYFATLQGIALESVFYRLRVSDGGIERVADLKGLRQAPPDFGDYWQGLTPDDSPLIMCDIGSQEIYALDLQLP
jgi:serine/threonine protein kinase/Tol biopolymer transport system component